MFIRTNVNDYVSQHTQLQKDNLVKAKHESQRNELPRCSAIPAELMHPIIAKPRRRGPPEVNVFQMQPRPAAHKFARPPQVNAFRKRAHESGALRYLLKTARRWRRRRPDHAELRSQKRIEDNSHRDNTTWRMRARDARGAQQVIARPMGCNASSARALPVYDTRAAPRSTFGDLWLAARHCRWYTLVRAVYALPRCSGIGDFSKICQAFFVGVLVLQACVWGCTYLWRTLHLQGEKLGFRWWYRVIRLPL